jgi:NAD(P)-dependent dehydrogenase (short-subunit alcohol dehydrogenase family)
MSFDLELTNRRALVTGGTKGVGAAVVQILCGAGAKVVATARSAPAQPFEGVHFLAADLSTPEGVSAVAQSMLKQLGGIDILVNVLGGSIAKGCTNVARTPLRRCSAPTGSPLAAESAPRSSSAGRRDC